MCDVQLEATSCYVQYSIRAVSLIDTKSLERLCTQPKDCDHDQAVVVAIGKHRSAISCSVLVFLSLPSWPPCIDRFDTMSRSIRSLH
jgi:hypothetical protein